MLLDEAWWTPLRPLVPVEPTRQQPAADLLERIRGERLTAWSVGDVTLDGEDELVIWQCPPEWWALSQGPDLR